MDSQRSRVDRAVSTQLEDRYRVLMIGVEEARPTSCFEWGLGEKSEVKNIVTQPNPHTGGWRLSFQCQSKGEPIELRAFLAEGDKPLSEVWVYRWTP